ncbi:ATP-binding protein [Paenibacillus glycanilyticus]|uniref:ATP-binding protein n=1 Tax=Paenibacillus glycanilyticus TaxID=126569 RepID=UPI002040727C|nr:ATP-binding protein [Paenibacillus glycanilyticus]MCM3630523.1 ATP-binding protein [Paenibacillus glycanilyticus]
MLKELLLQFFITLVPAFAFQLWHNSSRYWRRIPIIIGLSSCVSMALCMMFTKDYYGCELNFRLMPLLIGSLYGGPYFLLLLSGVYAALRIEYLDSVGETVVFASFMLVYLVFMPFVIKAFQRADRRRKIRIVMQLIFGMCAIVVLSFTVAVLTANMPITLEFVLLSLLTLVMSIVSSLISVYAVESFKENAQLHYDVKRMSTSLQQEVEKLQQFIDQTKIAVVLVNQYGKITHLNDMGYHLLADGKHENSPMIGQYFHEAFGEEETNVRLLREALRGQSPPRELPQIENGRTLLKTAFCIRNLQADTVTGAALIAQDITELSLLRNEVGRMERLSLIGQMAASITHEIRNPMAVIRGFVQLMRERSPESQQTYFGIVMDELDRANTIISDFLSLAQNRALTMEESSLHDIIREMVPLLNADANLRGQTIEVELCDFIPSIQLNEKEIKQLLLNLARNGMEAMSEKGRLSIHTSYIAEKEEIVLRIQDQGVGISEEQKQRIFDPFFSTKTQGTGLGLPLCVSIAERHNGRIDVESQQGVGTTFIVSFIRKTA